MTAVIGKVLGQSNEGRRVRGNGYRAGMSIVSIDVEPGGLTSPVCSIGVAELSAGQVTTQLGFKVKSPLSRVSPAGGSDLPPSGRRVAVLGCVCRRPLGVVLLRRYDRGALQRLCAAAGVAAPGWNFICGREAAIAAGLVGLRGFRELQSMVLGLGLLSTIEIDQRRELHRRSPQQKWLLHNAVDDAWANAMVLQRAADALGTPAEDLPSVVGIKRRPLTNA